MKQNIICFSAKAISKPTLCVLAVMVQIAAVANDGKLPATDAVKGPISYYQAFMLCVAFSYGIYLLVRARRRKRNSKITE